MDKNTLSNYGWVVIAVLVLAVMIALATPFGTYIRAGVENTTAGLFETSEKALNVVGMSADNGSFDGDTGSSTPTKDPALNPSGTIPENATYKQGSTTYNADDEFPATVNTGDVYVYGDYEYCYGYRFCNEGVWSNICGCYIECENWTVRCINNIAEPSEILESINEQPVTDMYHTFEGCTALTTAPKIPNSVTNMESTFFRCTALTTAPKIPNSVTSMNSTFWGCTSLTTPPDMSNANSVTNMTYTFAECTSLTDLSDFVIPNCVTSMPNTFYNCKNLTKAPAIPNSVTDMSLTFIYCTSLTTPPDMSNANSVTNMTNTFEGCTSLTTAPVIPNSVTNMRATFYNCTSLTTAPKIPSSVTNMYNAFYNCTALTGTITVPCQISDTWYDCPATIEQYHYTGCGH